jgi:2'-5' RNA ligase
VGALEPSRDTALILPVELPPGLEALRRRHVPDAADGLPAHVTLLYPFATPGSIDDAVRERIRAIVAGHGPFSMTLVGVGRWPDALYATVEPDGPVRALQADLAAAFPGLPLYGDLGLRFVPHVTVVEGPGVADPAVASDAAWVELPVDRHIPEVHLLVKADVRWRVAETWTFAPAA